MSNELQPCPFCGGSPTIVTGAQAFFDAEIHCDQCCATGPNFDEAGVLLNSEAAVNAWNARAPIKESL